MNPNPTRTRWDLVAMVAVVMTTAIVALIFHVPITDLSVIIGLGASPIISMIVLGNLQDVKKDVSQVQVQTNGVQAKQMEMLNGIVTHYQSLIQPAAITAGPPVIAAPVMEGTNAETH